MAKRLLFAASFIKEQDGKSMKKPLLLCIMDGFGINPADKGNAIKMAKTPNLDKLFLNYPHTQLSASGMAVGLPDGQMGNSEVGHIVQCCALRNGNSDFTRGVSSVVGSIAL